MASTLKPLEALRSKMNDQQQEFQAILKEFELQKQKFEEQKQEVDQYLAQNDVLNLDVGGEHFCTLRSTLTLIKGTIFDTLFSPDRKISLNRDNRIFLDYDPGLFKLMLNQLRQWVEVNDSDRVFEIPKTSIYDRQRFRNFLRHLKFDDKYFNLQFYDSSNQLVGGIVPVTPKPYNEKSPTCSYFYGSQMYSAGSHKIQIQVLHSNTYSPSYNTEGFGVGIGKFEKNKKQPPSSCISWPFQRTLPSGKDVFYEIEDGDIIEIELDCDNKLVITTNLRTTIVRHQIIGCNESGPNIPFPWMLCIKLHDNVSAHIRII